jgi:NAD(P)-dependent dehydrogenase (short-subunit alcohol dehydrogenase family)
MTAVAASDTKKLALVTGASRPEGIGCEVARQLARKGFHVLVSARSVSAAAARAEELEADGYDVVGEVLDVNDDASVKALAWKIGTKFGRLDVLVNNAGGPTSYGEHASTTDLARARETMEATLFGTWRVTQAFVPLLREGRSPRIVNVSSGAGSHGDPIYGLGSASSREARSLRAHGQSAMGPAYAASKAALNALTAMLARELAADRILVNAVCPGFTATFSGGEAMGARPVKEGAASVVWAALLPDDGPTGGFFRDGKPVPW